MFVGGVTAFTLVTACSATGGTGETAASTTATAGSDISPAAEVDSAGLFDSSTVHTVSIQYDEDDYQAMIATFVASGDKEWISATVAIDGTVFENVGIKLKGNSTLQGLRSTGSGAGAMPGGGLGGDLSADDPAGLPWRIRLDKFVDGQNYQGASDFVVRGGNTETSLNEAVALELIGAAGLATEQATPARFTVNDSTAVLRLVIENPDDAWDDANFDSDGILYKAEAGGDYSYRGDDPASYADAFSVEASTSGDDDYAPLIAFLKWVNESDDATFAADLGSKLDVASFAKYLAIQDLVANSDDIDGPGNNSYLRYDSATGTFTVVAWDQNLSFGGFGGGQGGPGQGGAGPGGGRMQPPDGAAIPSGAMPTGAMPSGVVPGDGMPAGAIPGGQGGGARGGNILAERFKANADFNALYEQALTDLRTQLYASGDAQQILDSWTAVLSAQAGDLVSQDTITSEAAAVAKYFTAS
jgi:spore coat protein CotH